MKREKIIENGIEYDVEIEEDLCCWYLGNKMHRVGGPAVIWENGDQEWWYDGKRHREDGPAFIFYQIDQYWWYQGAPVPVKSQEEFEQWLKFKVFQ